MSKSINDEQNGQKDVFVNKLSQINNKNPNRIQKHNSIANTGFYYNDIYEEDITVTDIKHYFYCPKIVFFNRVLNANQVILSQQRESSKRHILKEKNERRRKTILDENIINEKSRIFQTYISSEAIGLSGIVDCIVKNDNNEYIPVDYKQMNTDNGKSWIDHKFQIIAYSLLIEDHFSTTVNRGYIVYLPENRIVKITIRKTEKEYLKKIIKRIKNIIMTETEPHSNISKKRCSGGCGYLWICGGIKNRVY